MSFSSKVKEELAAVDDAGRHCWLAELAAITGACGRLQFEQGSAVCLELHTENGAAARKCFTLLRKTFNIEKMETSAVQSVAVGKSSGRIMRITGREQAAAIAQAIKAVPAADSAASFSISGLVAQNTCCKRAFIRGAFLAAGSVSDPEKAYHFEVVYSERGRAEQLKDIINSFSMDAKIILRKRYYVVYVKEGAQIVDLLNIMGAHISLMNFENIRILKEMRNSINRQVNCEAANIHKTVRAASRQIDDIIYIRDNMGFDGLAEGLEETAR
ncbi:MAG: DNA-binding protein WhiA, partial [Lachnospiraceae bacterium]|nr:DNA-binding protein WhiA [Lachnospiraceae bacterium]